MMNNSIPWTEKYRPTNIDDIILDDNVYQLIQVFLTNRNNLHLLITGNPGIGKTTTIKCIIKKLFDNNPSGFIEINATEDKTVKNATSVITSFCKRICDTETNKMIIFDEADNLTDKCQHDINCMIKQYGEKVKFVFICNYSSNIIEDLQSMCRIVRFRKISNENIAKYLTKICNKENIPFNQEGLNSICYIADGDMRRAINDLQKTSYTYNNITKKNVLEICNIPDPEDIKQIIYNCIDADLYLADTNLSNIIKKGYYFMDIVNCFSVVLETFPDISEELRLNLIEACFQTKMIISNGLRSKLQLSAMVCNLINICNRIS